MKSLSSYVLLYNRLRDQLLFDRVLNPNDFVKLQSCIILLRLAEQNGELPAAVTLESLAETAQALSDSLDDMKSKHQASLTKWN